MFSINLKGLLSLTGISGRDILALDFGNASLKIVQARVSPNKVELINVAIQDINGLSDDEIVLGIRACLAEWKVKNVLAIDVICPGSAITKNIEIPSTDFKEIREIINLQSGRHTPYSREEIIADYIDIGMFKNSYTKILLVIMLRSVLKRHYEIFHKSGLVLKHVRFSPEAIACVATKFFKLDSTDNPLAIFHVDTEVSTFVVTLKDKPLFTRSINIGAKQLTAEKEKCRLKFADELKKSLELYQSEDIDKSPKEIILVGATDAVSDLETFLNGTQHLSARAVAYAGFFFISEQLSQKVLNVHQASLFHMLSTISVVKDLKVDLIPEEIQISRKIAEKANDMVKIGVYVLTNLLLLVLIFVSNIYFKSSYLRRLEAKYNSFSSDVKILERNFTKIGLIKNYLNNRGYALEVLAALHNLIPSDLALTDIRYDEQGKFSLVGSAGTMSTVFSFMDSLEKSPFFKEVKVKYTSKRKEEGKEITDFEIAALLEK